MSGQECLQAVEELGIPYGVLVIRCRDYHEVQVGGEPATQYPTCIAGARQAPTEDVGETHAYEEHLTVMADAEREEH
jgi:hypothetical protein